ncbi:MAG TPA: hypothetical protein VFS21_18080 [Roseiflexaceae bacterium]|nr:hypothetical protein [Roseiflexaceae bacterium]
MNEHPQDQLEQRLRRAARDLRYPPTPDLAAAFRHRRTRPAPLRWSWGWRSALLAAVAVVALLAVPQVRAAALAILRIGVVEIIPAVQTPDAAPAATAPPPDPLRELRGATSLADAQARLPFSLRLPTEPADLGPPDAVFVQDLGGPAAILVWRDPAAPGRLRLALYALSSDVFGRKVGVTAIQETAVDGQPAVWASGPYVLRLGPANAEELATRRLVGGSTLIWERDDLTYRLESDLPLEAAVRIAESLR